MAQVATVDRALVGRAYLLEAVMNEVCPSCLGTGNSPKAAILPEPPDTKCFTCSGIGKICQRSVAQHKCLQCGNYHPAAMPCPHMLTWC